MAKYILTYKDITVYHRKRGTHPNCEKAWDVFYEDEGYFILLNPSPKRTNPWDPHFDATKVKNNADIQS